MHLTDTAGYGSKHLHRDGRDNVGGAAGKAAHLVGWKSPCRQLPDAGGEHIRWTGREQPVLGSDGKATAAPWVERPTAVGATWVASKPGGLNISE